MMGWLRGTGCSQGIGRALAYQLAEAETSGGGGYAAVFAGVRGGEQAAALLLRDAPSDAVRRALKPIELDVTDDAAISAAIQYIKAQLRLLPPAAPAEAEASDPEQQEGRKKKKGETQQKGAAPSRLQLVGLVNNAGVGGWSDVSGWERESWRETFDVNVFSVGALQRVIPPADMMRLSQVSLRACLCLFCCCALSHEASV